MSDDIQVFDGKGRFVMPPDAVIASLSPERRAKLMALRTAAEDAAKAETELRDAMAALDEAIKAQASAQATLDCLRPRVTATDAAKAWIASQAKNAQR
jgi:hypothetical protein